MLGWDVRSEMDGCKKNRLGLKLKAQKSSILTFLILVLSDIYPLCLWFACQYPCGPFAPSSPNLSCQTTAFWSFKFQKSVQNWIRNLWIFTNFSLNLTANRREMTEINPFLMLRWVWAWKLFSWWLKFIILNVQASSARWHLFIFYIFWGLLTIVWVKRKISSLMKLL